MKEHSSLLCVKIEDAIWREERIHIFIHLIHRPISICYIQKMQRWKDKVPLPLRRLEAKEERDVQTIRV